MDLRCIFILILTLRGSIQREMNVLATRRSTPFRDVWKQNRLSGKCFKNSFVHTTSHCAKLCSLVPKCRSFNICNYRICQLNEQDIFSLGGNRTLYLLHDPNCVYHGMLKDDAPLCQEDGSLKDIKDDQNPGACGINKKRVDAKWIWQLAAPIATEFSMEQEKTREIRSAAHSGRESANGQNDESGTLQVAYSLLFEKDSPKSWNRSVENCKLSAGSLFSNLDGERPQLDFLCSKMNDRSHWLGLTRVNDDLWVTVEGQPVDPSRIYFGSQGQAGFGHLINDCNGGNRGYAKTVDADNSLELPYICDKHPEFRSVFQY